MGRLRFIAGAVGILVGFFVYEFGFLLTLNLSPTVSDWTMAFLPQAGSLDVIGWMFQLLGGVVGIVGLLVCIGWVGSQLAAKPSLTGQPITPEHETRPVISLKKCKFCGADIEIDAAFCPTCQRAQV